MNKVSTGTTERRDTTHRFDGAMNVVYGQFDILSDEDSANWNPPDNPGAGGHHGRYLWTDAFGVLNLITLYQQTTSRNYLILAKRLVQVVHDVLGRTRDSAVRLPGATDKEPLKGGLRIGKLAAEGSDCDGQYHHYLTLWMFALNRLSLATKVEEYNDLAIQLAKAIHPHFVIRHPGGLKMVWKISTDMKTILVPSEGHLDAATGYAIYRMLQDTAHIHERRNELLRPEIEDYSQLMGSKPLTPSGDLLDLGMGLWITHFFTHEDWAAEFRHDALKLAEQVLNAGSTEMRRPASKRLAFREFGACLGILCSSADEQLKSKVAAVIEFWEQDQKVDNELKQISQVMYSAALIPGGRLSPWNGFGH